MYQQGYQPQNPKPDKKKGNGFSQVSPYGNGQQPQQPPPQQMPPQPPQQPPQQPPKQSYYVNPQANAFGTQAGATPKRRAPSGSFRPPRKKQSGRGKKKGGFHPLRWILLAVLLAALGAGGYVGTVWMDVRNYESVFAPNITIDGINVSGMTAEEGIAAVTAQAQNVTNSLNIRLTWQGETYTTITADMLELDFQMDEVLNSAWYIGKRGTIFDRQKEIKLVQEIGASFSSNMTDANTQIVDTIVSNLEANMYIAPVDATLSSVDLSKSYPFIFTQESQGRYLDAAPLKEKILNMIASFQSGEVAIEPIYTQPNVTQASLKEQYGLRATGYTLISTSSAEDRNRNITRACELINGTTLAPGQSFSFNGVVGERTLENGFYPALEYASGEHVYGIGGGVCQVSTSVYLAALTSGLQITNRVPHSMTVNYTEPSLDATVYWQYGRKIDFTFKNNTDSNIYIVAKVAKDPTGKTSRKACIISIYGLSLGNITYKVRSETVRTIPRETEEKKDTDATYVTYIDQTYTYSQGQDGVESKGFLQTYDNGTLISEKELSDDIYNATNKVVYVGVTPR